MNNLSPRHSDSQPRLATMGTSDTGSPVTVADESAISISTRNTSDADTVTI
jgi:hypothetical protein